MEIRHRDDLPTGIDIVLKQRGFVWSKSGDKGQVIEVENYTPEYFERWLKALSSLTCRKLLRKLAAEKRGVEASELVDICAEPTLTEYLSLFKNVGVTKREGRAWRLLKAVDNFGPTLEWYVASLASREFGAPSEWGIHIEAIYGGGDFDVLAWLDKLGALLYVECKSASPSQVSERELRRFFQRCQELAPEIAVFLVDTDSDLEPVLALAKDILDPLGHKVPEKPVAIENNPYSGIYFGERRVFFTGAHPSISTQLGKCLRYYSTFVQHASFWGEPPIDYIRGEVLSER